MQYILLAREERLKIIFVGIGSFVCLQVLNLPRKI